jgi:two-component system response regulator HydG
VKDAIITVDRDLTITALNEAGHGICVFNRDAVGKPLRQAAEGCDMGCLRTVEETLRTKQPINRYKFECSRQETSRKDRPLVKVNCSALSESLLESELFGHVKGAFTGAMNDKTGRFEKASGGTIFLDEIGDLSPKIQQKLLRVLQEKEFERVGDSTPVKVDVRIVAATNRDLRAMSARGEFREDLLYRIRVVEIKLPPLRERSEDIPLLVEFFLSEFNSEFSKKIEGVSSDVMKLFMNYRWPGNVRELRHALEHVCVLCKKPTITTEDLPSEFRELSGIKSELPADLTTDEASVFLQALKDAKWNKTEVARLLGMSRQTLYRKLKALGIED